MKRSQLSPSAAAILAAAILFSAGLSAAQSDTRLVREPFIHYAGGHFEPARIVVPAGEPLVVHVVNDSKERIEFESFRLHREKVVDSGKTILVRLGALKPGTYDFFDDFHEKVPEGEIVAVAAHK